MAGTVAVARKWGGLAKPTPSDDMGVEFRPDWLTVTLWASPEVVRAAAEQLVGGDRHEWEQRGGGSFFAKAHVLIGRGLKVYSDPVGAREQFCSLIVEGSAWAGQDLARARAWLLGLTGRGLRWRVTRLDLAWDRAPLTPADAYAAACDGNVRSLAKRDTCRFEQALPGFAGNTFKWGSRSSERYLRIYDGRGYTRVELELKGDRAGAVLAELLALPVEGWAVEAVAHLRQFIDFVERGQAHSLDACPLVGWWAAFVEDGGRADLKLQRRAPTLERAVEWVRRIAPTLTAVEAACGRGFMASALVAGERRQGPRHRALVAEAAFAWRAA